MTARRLQRGREIPSIGGETGRPPQRTAGRGGFTQGKLSLNGTHPYPSVDGSKDPSADG